MPSKHRQYTIVIHNVDEKSQPIVKHYAAQAKEYVMSIEPYPQGNGSHLHLFIQYSNPRSFRAVLNELERFKKRIVVPRPQDESRDWGRVQLDVMRGRFSQANSYLMGETKDKPTGEVCSQKKGIVLYSPEQRQKVKLWFDKCQSTTMIASNRMVVLGDIWSPWLN